MRGVVLLALLASAGAAADQCGDIMCMDDETCCKDFPGAVEQTECCISVATFCVAPRGPFTTSTCCPKWTVGCTSGSVGCCDPARPWQDLTVTKREPIDARQPNLGQRLRSRTAHSDATATSSSKLRASSTLTSNASLVGYALFPSTSMITTGMQALAFDAATGVVTSTKPITGPFGTYYSGYYGGSTRILPFDPSRGKFYFADLFDATAAPQRARRTADAPLVVFTVDPAAGESAAVPVSGCPSRYPVGMAYDAESAALVVGAHDEQNNATFCAIDPTTGQGTPMGTVARGASEEASDLFYSAYLSLVSAGTALRVGHRLVTAGGEPGKTTTALDASGGSAVTAAFEPIAFRGYGLPASVSAHPAGGFVSLVPRTGLRAGGYDILGWDAGGGQRVLANLSNAYPPSIPYTKAPLGYVGDAVAGSTYGTMTVARGKQSIGDEWQVSLLDLESGALAEMALEPQPSVLGAEATALSGFGLLAVA